MQTILGASGQIGRELAVALKHLNRDQLRLVSRNPRKVHADDQLHRADLLDAQQTLDAVAGSHTVYLTAGLPMDTQRWVAQWPLLMHNAIEACATHRTRLVFFDNTYMYPQTSTLHLSRMAKRAAYARRSPCNCSMRCMPATLRH